MKKLRVYYKCSLLGHSLIFDVASPAEGKVLIDALESTVSDIIADNNIQVTGTYAIGLEIEDETMDEGWADWSSPAEGKDVFEFTPEELREMEVFRATPFE